MTRKSSVWVVDDDASIRWVLEKALSNAGFAVTLFDRADDVLKRIGREQPDVIVPTFACPVPAVWNCSTCSAKTCPVFPSS